MRTPLENGGMKDFLLFFLGFAGVDCKFKYAWGINFLKYFEMTSLCYWGYGHSQKILGFTKILKIGKNFLIFGAALAYKLSALFGVFLNLNMA